MVRGGMYATGDIVRSRRAASVPVGDLSPLEVDRSILNKAHVITSHAVQDADAIRAQSKQHDINFLNDISHKLAAAQQPSHHYRDSTPVYIGSRYPPPANHSTVSDYRRRTWVSPPVNDYEVSNYLSGGYRAPGVRSSPARGPSVPRWGHEPSPTRSVRGGSVSRGYSKDKLAPYEDVVVGVAHTSLYGDIVIGIPYNKRHMFDMDGSEKSGNNVRVYRPSPAAGSRHSISGGNYPTIGTVVVAPTTRRSSISVPMSPGSVRRRTPLTDDVEDYLSSTPHRFRSTANYNTTGDWSSSLPPLGASYSSRPPSVPRQLNGVSDYKSSAPLYSSGYSGAPYNSSSYVGSSLPPPSGSSIPPKAPRTVTRPPMSEARRKVRDLLCKTKNDPHYFDGM